MFTQEEIDFITQSCNLNHSVILQRYQNVYMTKGSNHKSTIEMNQEVTKAAKLTESIITKINNK